MKKFVIIFLTIVACFLSAKCAKAEVNAAEQQNKKMYRGATNGYNVTVTEEDGALLVIISAALRPEDYNKPYTTTTIVTGVSTREEYVKNGSWLYLTCNYVGPGEELKSFAFQRSGEKWENDTNNMINAPIGYVDYRVVFFALDKIKEAMTATYKPGNEIPWEDEIKL